jgi:hypothetical protein
LLLALTAATSAQDQPDPFADIHDDTSRLMRIAFGVHEYAQKNSGRIPPDLASVATFFTKEGESTPDVIRARFLAPGVGAVEVPRDAKAGWVNEHSSYVYLGRPDVTLRDIPQWGDVAIAHLRFDLGHPTEVSALNPEGQFSAVAFMDGHSAYMPRSEARAVAAESAKVIEAVRTGGELPDVFQLSFDLQAVGEALKGYAKEHAGELPPDLGAALEFVKDSKRTHTAAQRAAVFLSPRVKKGLHIPEEPTAAWVNQHTSFVYLAGGVKLAAIEDPQRTILVHVRPEDVTTSAPEMGKEFFGVITGWGGVDLANRKYYDWIIAYSKQVIEAAKSGAPLPDSAHAMRDIRFILRAIEGYAKAHEGMLPPDLGSTMEYLPEDVFGKATARDRARVYLSPRAERVNLPPEDADAAWVNAHGDYRYLGDARVSWKGLMKTIGITLVHAPLDEEFTSMQYNFDEPYKVTPVGQSIGGAELRMTKGGGNAEELLDTAKVELQKIRQESAEKK